MISAIATILLLALLTFCLGILHSRRDEHGLAVVVFYIVGMLLMGCAVIIILLVVIDAD